MTTDQIHPGTAAADPLTLANHAGAADVRASLQALAASTADAELRQLITRTLRGELRLHELAAAPAFDRVVSAHLAGSTAKARPHPDGHD